MALGFTNLTNNGATAATSFNTASVAPAGNQLILVTVHAYVSTGSAQPPQPTVSGNGITYALVKAQDTDTAGADRATMWVFRGMAASPSSGVITIDFGATSISRCQWSVDQSSTEVDTSGTNGSGAIVTANVTGSTSAGNVTLLSINYPQSMVSGNAGYSAWGHLASVAATQRTNWTELADVTATTLIATETQYISGTDTAGSVDWGASSARSGGIIIEVQAAAGGTSANAELASGTGSALDAQADLGVTGDVASGTGSALDATAALAVTADVAAGTGPAYDATVSTTGGTNAQADVASGTGTAYDASVAIAITADIASGAGTALDAQGVTGAQADAASGSGAALDALTAIAANAGFASGVGTALDAIGQGGIQVAAGLASGTGSALDATAAIVAAAEATLASGIAHDATGINVPLAIPGYGTHTVGATIGTAITDRTSGTVVIETVSGKVTVG